MRLVAGKTPYAWKVFLNGVEVQRTGQQSFKGGVVEVDDTTREVVVLTGEIDRIKCECERKTIIAESVIIRPAELLIEIELDQAQMP